VRRVADINIEEFEDPEIGAYVVLRPMGDIDAYSVGKFREALAGLADTPKIVIDLSEVPFMDSAGLGALIGGIRRARDNEGLVVVACDRPSLTRLLHTTGFDRIVPVAESLDEAIEAVRNGGELG